MLQKPKRMEAVVRGMAAHLTCPLTIKVRTGYQTGVNTAHEVLSTVASWGACAATLHGRSRQQRCGLLAGDCARSCLHRRWSCQEGLVGACACSQASYQMSAVSVRTLHAGCSIMVLCRWARCSPGASCLRQASYAAMCRYTGLADWDYIGQCAQGCGDLQLIGNGDVFTHQAYEARLKAAPGLATAMVARAALIKPWLFTEVSPG